MPLGQEIGGAQGERRRRCGLELRIGEGSGRERRGEGSAWERRGDRRRCWSAAQGGPREM